MPKAIRPPSDQLALPWRPDEACPCGSGRVLRLCCLTIFKTLEVGIPTVAPSGPQTGYAHGRCYLGSLYDCSPTISGEHVISDSVLKQIAEDGWVATNGLPWFEDNKAVPTKALVANVLCRRHNTALSPLDDSAAHTFRQVRAAFEYATKDSLVRRPAYFLASGEGLERWALKVLLGFIYAKHARFNGEVLLGNFLLEMKPIMDGLFGRGMSSPLGVYVDAESHQQFDEYVSVAPLIASNTKLVGGLRLNLGGLAFHIVTDSSNGNPEFFENPRFHKPWAIDLDGPRRSSRLVLTWPQGAARQIRVGIKIGAARSLAR